MAKYAGKIKSFNLQRGWGFIECAETQQIYGKDIFVMKRALPGGSASKGDRVRFDVAQGPSGPEATEVEVFADGDGVGAGAQSGGNAIGSKAWAMSRPPNGNSGGRPSTGFLGYVKSYNPTKGWGFVTSEAMVQLYGKDIFFMKTSVRSQGVDTGDQVRFTIMQGAKGPEATDVQLASAVPNGFGVFPEGRRRVIGARSTTERQSTAARPRAGAAAGGGGSGGGYWSQHSAAPALPALPALPAPRGATPTAAAAVGSGQMLFGAIKGYNPEKGWGHIDCTAARDLYGKDVFVMRTELGEQVVHPGTLVSFRVVMAAKGPHAADVSVLPDGCFGMGGAQGSYFDGTIKSYSSQKGWGFVTSEEIVQIFGKDIFLHKHELEGLEPEPGTIVNFTVEPGRTGQLEAKNVSLSTGEPPGPASTPGANYRASRPGASVDRRARPY